MVQTDSRQSPRDVLLLKLRQIALVVPAPVVVYFEQRIVSNLDDLQRQLPNLDIRVSLKAAGSPHVLRSLVNKNVVIDVASLQEYEAATAFGIQPRRVAFYSPGTDGTQLVNLSRLGVRVLLDTWEQVEAYCLAGSGQNVGLRILCNTRLRQGEGKIDCVSSPKFGIPRNQVLRVASRLADSGIKIVELSAHLGSSIHSVDPYLRLAAELAEAANALDDVSVLNLGGGFVPNCATTPLTDMHKLNEVAVALRNRPIRPLSVVVEPGRSIFADAAAIIATVKAVKAIDENSVVISDARFATTGTQCELTPLHNRSGDCEFAVYGDSCSPDDYIGQLSCGPLSAADKFVVFNVGAYAIQLCGHLQLRPKGTEVFVAESGDWEISRRALTTEDFLRLMV